MSVSALATVPDRRDRYRAELYTRVAFRDPADTWSAWDVVQGFWVDEDRTFATPDDPELLRWLADLAAQRVCVVCDWRVVATGPTSYRHDTASMDEDHRAQPTLAHPMDDDRFAGMPGVDDTEDSTGDRPGERHLYATYDAVVLAAEVEHAVAEDTRTCWMPGDQEHDHGMCEDVVAENTEVRESGAGEPALTTVAPLRRSSDDQHEAIRYFRAEFGLRWRVHPDGRVQHHIASGWTESSATLDDLLEDRRVTEELR